MIGSATSVPLCQRSSVLSTLFPLLLVGDIQDTAHCYDMTLLPAEPGDGGEGGRVRTLCHKLPCLQCIFNSLSVYLLFPFPSMAEI